MAGAIPDPMAVRYDPSSDADHEVAFFGETERVFGAVHRPRRGADAGVVVCPPLGGEFDFNYRRETKLAGVLAQRGIGVVRFHYRGSGHSDGDTTEITWDRMVEDGLAAVDHLLARTGASSVGFVGTRVGGLVAAAVARAHPGAPLVLWRPLLTGAAFFRDAIRATFVAGLSEGAASEPPSQEAMLSRLHDQGWLDVVGYTLGLSLYESIRDRKLEREVGPDPRPVLMVDPGRGQGFVRAHQELLDRWKGAGWDADGRTIDDAQALWYGERGRGKALASLTADWLVPRLRTSVAA